MAKYSSADAYLFFDGYDLTGYNTALEIETRQPTQDLTVFSKAWREYAALPVKEADVTHDAFYDDAALGPDAALVGIGGSGTLLTFLEGNTLGKRAVGMAGLIRGGYTRTAAIGSFHKAKGTFAVTGAVEDGKVQQPLATITGSAGDGTALDNGASSANGGAGYLQVTALTLGGYTSVTIKISHSTDNVTYTDLITFANVTAAPADERKTVTGTVNRYTRMSYTFNGTGSGQSITFAQGFIRN